MLAKKLLSILADIYWDSKIGWLEKERWPDAEKIKLLEEAGLYYPIVNVSHDEVIERYLAIKDAVDVNALASRFLTTLSKRNDIEYRADLQAYVNLPEDLKPHPFEGKGLCKRCGVPDCRSSAVFGQQQVEIKRDLEWC